MTSSLNIKVVNIMSKEKKRVEPPLATSKVIQITKSGKFFLVESAIQGFGFRNLAQGIRNPD